VTAAQVHFRSWRAGWAVNLCRGERGKDGGTTTPEWRNVTCQACLARKERAA
jgi:hypothetical protein